jgi:hypothetical protein
MSTRSPAFSLNHGPLRQLLLAVLLLFQAAISAAPLFEPTDRGRMGAHVEQQARHKYQHDEATCAVCAVRSLHSSPAHACPAVECEFQRTVAALEAPVAPGQSRESSVLPRAPPLRT